MVMLGLIYLFATAKPISVRRLSALFVLALISANLGLRVLQITDASKNSLLIATSLVLLVWSIPLLRTLHQTVCNRSLVLDALHPVSAFVRLTYGLALAALPIAAITALSPPLHSVHLAILLRLLVIAGVAAFLAQPGLTLGTPRMSSTPRRSHRCEFSTVIRGQ
jgi:hypothetical protein